MAEYVDSAVQTVLSSSRLKLAHPGNAKLTQVYPTPSETTSVLAQAVNNRGQFRVSSNTKNFGARSDFILSTSALFSEMAITGVFKWTNAVGLESKLNAVGYGFDLIESIEITYSNSLMQNMFIQGQIFKEWSLLTCCSARERQDMLLSAGGQRSINLTGENTAKFTIPLNYLNHKASSLRNSWPTDGSVLAGPVQIAINWRESKFAFVKTVAVAPAPLPTEFDSLVLTCKTTQLQDASFSVKKAMMLDPQLVYSLPSTYITSVNYSRDLVQGAETVINLSSAPAGMLEGLIVSIRPALSSATPTPVPQTSWTDPGDAQLVNYRGGSTTLDDIKLTFGGQNIYRCDSYEEMMHFNRCTFGDNLQWGGIYFDQGAAYAQSGSDTHVYKHPLVFIPLMNDGYSVLRQHTNENLPSYGGSQLQLTIRPSGRQRIGGNNARSIDGVESDVVIEATAKYEIVVGFVISGLLEISQGTVDLQL